MTIPLQKKIRIPEPPKEYDPVWLQHFVKTLDSYFEILNNAGAIRATTITLTDLPTSATGLESGALWNDAGTVKIV